MAGRGRRSTPNPRASDVNTTMAVPRPISTGHSAEASDVRKSQVRTVDRSERVRTYNFPENRIADHRVNYKSHNLDAVLDGELDDVIDALTDADMAVRLAAS